MDEVRMGQVGLCHLFSEVEQLSRGLSSLAAYQGTQSPLFQHSPIEKGKSRQRLASGGINILTLF